MIPKIIHYCWFGKGEKSALIQKCINSWHQYLPDYQIIEWNENNFSVNELKYTRDAYKAKKYAFVSDVARVKALYEYGGIYLDTDVEVFQSFDSILDNKCVLGFEEGNYIATSMMATEAQFDFFLDFYNLYKKIPFINENGEINQTTNVSKITQLLIQQGLKRDNTLQILSNGIKVYPLEYFSPYIYGYGTYLYTKNTICVHYFDISWQPKRVKILRNIKKYIVWIIGLENTRKLIDVFRSIFNRKKG